MDAHEQLLMDIVIFADWQQMKGNCFLAARWRGHGSPGTTRYRGDLEYGFRQQRDKTSRNFGAQFSSQPNEN